jgi:hypothetical protein
MPSNVCCSFSTAPPASHCARRRSSFGCWPIAGQVLGEIVYLSRQAPPARPRAANTRWPQQDRWNATDPTLEPADGWRQDEGQKDGERERHEDGLGPVQNGDNEHAPGERHPGLHGFRGVVQGS